MFIEYQQLVFQAYQKKKTNNAISPRLIHPTPGEIKKECIAVCRERYLKKDESCLMRFFGKCEDQAAYVQAIENHGTDKFKPLVNYLKSKVGTTEYKNTELLSWLINFEPRPFDYGKRYIVEPEEIETQVPGPQIEEDNKNNGKKIATVTFKEAKINFKILIISTLIFLLISVGTSVYLLLKPDDPQGCMYWADDHYEAVSCNQKYRDKLVLALDSVKLHHFKRVTEPDTITWKSKGSLWYVKVDDKVEFYTSDGFHPVQLEKRLRPVTDYIIYKYAYRE